VFVAEIAFHLLSILALRHRVVFIRGDGFYVDIVLLVVGASRACESVFPVDMINVKHSINIVLFSLLAFAAQGLLIQGSVPQPKELLLFNVSIYNVQHGDGAYT
jgi:hypothetical protein